jgi:hypothetical protein
MCSLTSLAQDKFPAFFKAFLALRQRASGAAGGAAAAAGSDGDSAEQQQQRPLSMAESTALLTFTINIFQVQCEVYHPFGHTPAWWACMAR